MKSKLLIISTIAVILGGLVMLPKETLAYKKDPNVKGPNYSVERHSAMEKAFETKNYNAWKSLMQARGRVTQIVNKDNFAKFAQAHELTELGKIAEANKIRQELGLGFNRK